MSEADSIIAYKHSQAVDSNVYGDILYAYLIRNYLLLANNTYSLCSPCNNGSIILCVYLHICQTQIHFIISNATVQLHLIACYLNAERFIRGHVFKQRS